MGSADLMPRNLDRRIETLFPIDDYNLKQQLIDILEIVASDNVNARTLLSDGTYSHAQPGAKEPLRSSQEIFMANARTVQ